MFLLLIFPPAASNGLPLVVLLLLILLLYGLEKFTGEDDDEDDGDNEDKKEVEEKEEEGKNKDDEDGCGRIWYTVPDCHLDTANLVSHPVYKGPDKISFSVIVLLPSAHTTPHTLTILEKSGHSMTPENLPFICLFSSISFNWSFILSFNLSYFILNIIPYDNSRPKNLLTIFIIFEFGFGYLINIFLFFIFTCVTSNIPPSASHLTNSASFSSSHFIKRAEPTGSNFHDEMDITIPIWSSNSSLPSLPSFPSLLLFPSLLSFIDLFEFEVEVEVGNIGTDSSVREIGILYLSLFSSSSLIISFNIWLGDVINPGGEPDKKTDGIPSLFNPVPTPIIPVVAVRAEVLTVRAAVFTACFFRGRHT